MGQCTGFICLSALDSKHNIAKILAVFLSSKKIPLINFFQDADPLLKKIWLKDYWTVTKGWLCREGGKF